MKTVIRPQAKKIAWMLALLYFSSYIMRLNFAVMLVKVISDTGSTKSELSIVVTAMTLVYGAGQILSGILGDRIKPQHLLSAGLALAAVCNTAMFFCTSVPAMAVVWGVNGFAHALLWPPIIRLMSMYLDDNEYSYSAVRVAWGSSGATILLYLVCPLLLPHLGWRTVMLFCAAVGIAVLCLWLVVNRRLFGEPLQTKALRTDAKAPASHLPLPRYVYLPVALIMLGIILQGMLRDGVTNWMPSYMLETFSLSEESAIITAVIPAIFSMLSFFLFEQLHRKLFQNEVFCAAMIFSLSAVAATVLWIVSTLFSSPLLSTCLLALIIAAMHGINLMLISVVPKRFAKSGKVSTYSGLLNACTYVGAAISSYGFAALAEGFGWSITILVWIVISALGLLLTLLASPLWKKFRREYADN
ncbi:MAG: MFS transporter [Ruminococcaceae bacterium]|nr:MFS transporter [Oscillospiraceae bacterium]